VFIQFRCGFDSCALHFDDLLDVLYSYAVLHDIVGCSCSMLITYILTRAFVRAHCDICNSHWINITIYMCLGSSALPICIDLAFSGWSCFPGLDWDYLLTMSIVPYQSSDRGDAASAAIGRQHSGSELGGLNLADAETLPAAGANALSCWFCDQNENIVGKMLNVATAAYPKHACSGCNGSRKALNKQGAENPTAKAALAQLKKRQADYKAHVVSAVIPGANAKGQGGAVAKQTRSETLGTFFTHSVESSLTLEHARPVMWCLKAEYVGYYMHTHAKTREDATAQWLKDVANVEVTRKGEGEGLRILVLGIPTSTEIVGRKAKRSIGATYAADTDAKMAAASKRMALNNLPHMSSQMFLDAGGDVFGTGHASGSNSAHRSAAHIAIDDETPLHREEFAKAALALADTVEEPADEDDELDEHMKTRTRPDTLKPGAYMS
jgi:hypothetical protein